MTFLVLKPAFQKMASGGYGTWGTCPDSWLRQAIRVPRQEPIRVWSASSTGWPSKMTFFFWSLNFRKWPPEVMAHEQCGIKCLMGCDHKIKTKMVCENIMHNRTLRGDKFHKPLSHSSPFWKFWSLSRKNNTFWNVLKNCIVSERIHAILLHFG